jgi:predicted nucleic acid-binding protein
MISSPNVETCRHKKEICSKWRFATSFDTNTVSYIIKGNIPRIRERLLKVPIAEVGLSFVTEAELLFRAARRPEATRLRVAVEEFLLRAEVLPWTSYAAQQYAGSELRWSAK